MSDNTITRTDPTGAEINVTEQKSAGAFDLRNVIGALMGVYGLVLLLAYFVLDPGVDVSTGEPKVAEYNLWTGLALVVAAAVFFLWAKFNPIKVEATDTVQED